MMDVVFEKPFLRSLTYQRNEKDRFLQVPNVFVHQ